VLLCAEGGGGKEWEKAASYSVQVKRGNKHSSSSRDSSVGIVTGYELDDLRVGYSSTGGVKNFDFSLSTRPALGPTQPPIQWLPGALPPG
jgi:hypothetical protein